MVTNNFCRCTTGLNYWSTSFYFVKYLLGAGFQMCETNKKKKLIFSLVCTLVFPNLQIIEEV